MTIEQVKSYVHPADKPSAVVTVRMPEELRQKLRMVSRASMTAINTICLVAIETAIADLSKELENNANSLPPTT